MKQQKFTPIKFSNNLPFPGRDRQKDKKVKRTKAELLEGQTKAANEILNYMLTEIDRDRFLKWSFEAVQNLNYSRHKKDRGGVNLLGGMAEILLPGASQEEIIRILNGFEIEEVNPAIEEIARAFFCYPEEVLSAEKYTEYFYNLGHIVKLNKLMYEYKWFEKVFYNMEKANAETWEVYQ